MKRTALLCLPALILASPSSLPAGQGPAVSLEFQAWALALEQRGIKVAAGVWELDTGRLVEGQGLDEPMIPASTTKVVSTYPLLKIWKPDAILETEVWGDLRGDTIQGDLVLKGAGDPFLVEERVWLIAQALKKQGVARITGRIRPDQSAFDGQMYGPGWENTSADTTPPILPLSVNFNRDDKGRIMRDPSALAQATFTRVFQEAGIAVEGQPVRGGAPRKLHVHNSLTLRHLIEDANKYSNNFMVEMLVKRFGGGSWPEATKRIQAFYQERLGLGPDKVAITDGSGLSKRNRLSPRTLATILRAIWHDYEVGPEMASSLKVIGGEPVRKQSFFDPYLTRRVRCKTGHLTDVVALCGYIQRLDGSLRVFAILLNGPAKDEDILEQVIRWSN